MHANIKNQDEDNSMFLKTPCTHVWSADTIDISFNFLRGALHSALGGLTHLSSLTLRANSLQGALPTEPGLFLRE